MYFLSAGQSITVGAAAWTTVDLTVAPYNVPAGSSFAVVRVRVLHAGTTEIGFRHPTSSEAKWGEGAYSGIFDAIVPMDGSGNIEVYSQHSTASGNISFHLMGYLSSYDGTAFETPVDVTPTVPAAPANHPLLAGSWVTINASSCVPSTAKWAVIEVGGVSQYIQDGTTGDYGCFRSRKYGTTLPTFGTNYAHRNLHTFELVPVDGSGRFDVYGHLISRVSYPTASRTIKVWGYVNCGSHNETPATTDTGSTSTEATWVTKTLSKSAVATVIGAYTRIGFSGNFGYRHNGSTDTLYSSGGVIPTISSTVVPVDSSNQWQIYKSDSGYYTSYYYTLGWLDTEAGTVEPGTVSDALVQDLYTPRNDGSSDGVVESIASSDYTGYDINFIVSESSVISDATLRDMDPLPVAESAAAADVLAVAHALGGVIAESYSISDFLDYEFFHIRGVSSKTTARVRVESNGIIGFVGSGSAALLVRGSGDGLFGEILTVSSRVIVRSDITALHGAISTGSAGIPPVRVRFPRNSSIGNIGTASSRIVVRSLGNGFGGYIGSGSARIKYDARGVSYFAALINGQWIVYAMNLNNGAITQHGTKYNSWCMVDETLYAADQNGIYEVIGHDDDGVGINAVIAKGGMDFGVPFKKYLSDMYLRLMSKDDFDVSVSSEYSNGTAVLEDGVMQLHGAKVDLPRGVAGRELGFDIRNRDGKWFELSEIELAFIKSITRRGRQNHG